MTAYGLIDTTEMYLRTLFELEEEGIPPLRARIVERLSQSGPTVSQTVARMERDQPAVLGMTLDDAELGRIGGDPVALLAQALGRRLRLVGGGLRVAAGGQERQQQREEGHDPHRAATVPCRAVGNTAGAAPVFPPQR